MNIFNKFKVNNEEYQLDWENGIGNKPFGTESTVVDILPSQELTFTEFVEGKYGTMVESDSIVIKEGRTYTVTFDNDVYECIGAAIATLDMQFIALGNLSLNETGEDTGEPFAIGYTTGGLEIITNSSGSHTMKIQTAEKTIKQLDSKYIKDMYGEVNKVEEILPLQPLELSLEGTDDYGTYIPTTMDYEIKIGDYITVTYEGIEYNCETYDMSPIIGCGFEVPVIGNAFGESTEPFVMLFDTTGALSGEGQVIAIMDTTPPQEGVETITREVGIKYNVHKINYINPKYIKDIYHAEDGEYETVIESHEVEFEYDESDGVYYGDLPVTVFEVGKKYKIIVDGVEYVRVCGDGTIPLATIDFVIMYGYSNDIVNSTTIMTNEEGTTHTIAIEVQGDEIIHQVPSKYVNAYTKEEIDNMFGTYVTEVDALLGGE